MDYLVFDYLAELTMSIPGRRARKKPELGYATDFVSVAMKQVLKDVVARASAWSATPVASTPGLRRRTGRLAAELGVRVKIATVVATT